MRPEKAWGTLNEPMLPLVFQLTSPAFTPGALIPARHTCSGENLSPPLEWTTPPPGTQSLALIVDDPDAPRRVWTHWLVWSIPASLRGLPEGVLAGASGFVQGQSDFGTAAYGGPCPPAGQGAHRYFARLYALDVPIPLSAGASRVELESAMRGHVLATTELMGKAFR